jgi:hypothetical protein
MIEAELLKLTVSEYKAAMLLRTAEGSLDPNCLVENLSSAHGWTQEGARAIVSLANQYGVFMLRNALAIAIVLCKEDGDLGF